MATIVVNTTVDELDGSITDGDISLRDAVAAANAAAGADTIAFDATVFDGEAGDTLRLTQGEIVITDAVTIDGGASGVTITGDKDGDDVVLAGGITDVDASLEGDDRLDDNSRIFNITDADAETTLNGLVLTGGRGGEGGAVRSNASLTVAGSTVAGNAAFGYGNGGGGILVPGTVAVTVTNSTISGNRTFGYYAGGGGIEAGHVSLVNSTVIGNRTSGYDSGGGGIYSGDTELINSKVIGNSTTGDNSGGGGITGGLYSIRLTDSEVSGNSTSGFGSKGGGIAGTRVTLTNSTVSGNSTSFDDSGGGGIYAQVAATLTNSTVSGNSTAGDGSHGGGILGGLIFDFQGFGSVTLLNSTVTGNSVSGEGALVGGVMGQYVSLTNSLSVGNVAVQTLDDDVGTAKTLFLDSSLAGGDGRQVFADTTEIAPGIFAGVLADNGGPTQTVAILRDGLAAGGADPATATATDQRGVARDAEPDIGAFEATPANLVVVVDTAEDVVDAADGKTSLREAVALANATAGHDTITFEPAVFDGEAGDILRLTQGEIVITDAVTIDGGAGVTITGDANSDDVTLAGGITDVQASLDSSTLDDNSRIFDITDASAETTLEGLVLTGGRARDDGGAVRSAAPLELVGSTVSGNNVYGFDLRGVAIHGTRISLTSTTISNNFGQTTFDIDDATGGGIWSSGAVLLTDSQIISNKAGGGYVKGGGIYAGGDVTLVGSLVHANDGSGRGDGAGGGIFAGGRTVTLIDSTVSGNGTGGELGGYGGGIFAGTAILTRSTVSGNVAGAADSGATGGGIRAEVVMLTDSTVANNRATSLEGGSGGGIFGDTVTLVNSTVSGNSIEDQLGNPAGDSGGVAARTTLTIGNSIVLGNFDRTTGAASEVSAGTTVQSVPNIIGGVAPNAVFETIDPATGGGLLADNGGPTETIAILPDGLAAGAADPATATEIDQRGVLRDAEPDLGAFEAERVGPPEPFRIEAESLARERGFRVENIPAASGGKVIKSPDPNIEASASFTFTGPDGTYDLDLGYFDEKDGRSELSVFVNDIEVDSFVFRANLGSKLANAQTAAVREIGDIQIETGDVIELVGHSNRDEPLRIDYLEFTFVDDLVA